MDITVTGLIGRRADKQKLIEAAEFFAAQLMDPRMVKNITLDIEVWKDLDIEGECVDEDGTKNPRWFTIGLKNQDIEEMIKVLGHEMVHVKQHAKNELQTGHAVAARGGLKIYSKWMGQIWKPKGKMPISMLLGKSRHMVAKSVFITSGVQQKTLDKSSRL